MGDIKPRKNEEKTKKIGPNLMPILENHVPLKKLGPNSIFFAWDDKFLFSSLALVDEFSSSLALNLALVENSIGQ